MIETLYYFLERTKTKNHIFPLFRYRHGGTKRHICIETLWQSRRRRGKWTTSNSWEASSIVVDQVQRLAVNNVEGTLRPGRRLLGQAQKTVYHVPGSRMLEALCKGVPKGVSLKRLLSKTLSFRKIFFHHNFGWNKVVLGESGSTAYHSW